MVHMVHYETTDARLVGIVLARVNAAGMSQRRAAQVSGLPWSTFKRCVDTGRLDVRQAEAMASLVAHLENQKVSLSDLLARAERGAA